MENQEKLEKMEALKREFENLTDVQLSDPVRVSPEPAGSEVTRGRELTDHKIDGVDNLITIEVGDAPGAGGACHLYTVYGGNEDDGSAQRGWSQHIAFQNGPVKECGSNGLTQECLLAIVLDRLRGFQSGNFSCRENAIAITHIETALMFLQKRTRDRLARGVEGLNIK